MYHLISYDPALQRVTLEIEDTCVSGTATYLVNYAQMQVLTASR